VLLAALIAIDIVVAICQSLLPETITAIACTGRPFGVLAHPLMSKAALVILDNPCPLTPTEPWLSLTTLSLKISISVITVPIFWFIGRNAPELTNAKQDTFDLLRKGGYSAVAKDAIPGAFFIAISVIVLGYGSTHPVFGVFRSSFIHKILEDVFCCVVVVTPFFILILYQSLVQFPIQYHLSLQTKKECDCRKHESVDD
jgi:hypothetical protein